MCLLYELLPEEFRKHERAAKRERLLAWRALVDAGLNELEGHDPAEHNRAKSAFWSHRRAARRETMQAYGRLFEGCMLGIMGGGHERSKPADAPTRIEII
jgi:hypothetical protein